MRRGGFGGGLFAVYVPSPHAGTAMDKAMDRPPYDLPLPEPISAADAAGLPALIDALAAHGYDAALLRKLARHNGIRVPERTWGG